MSPRRSPSVAIAVALLAATIPARAEPSSLPPTLAYAYGQTETPRTLGVGAMHALGSGVAAMFANPANLGLKRSYEMAAIGEVAPEAGRQLFGGAVTDSTRPFAGGSSFIAGFQDPDGIDRKTLDARVALGLSVTDSLLVGVTGRYLDVDQDGLGPLGNSRASGGNSDPDGGAGPSGAPGRASMLRAYTFDAGVTLRATDALVLAAYGHNLTFANHGLLPAIVGGAVGYDAGGLALEVDAEVDLTSWDAPSTRVMGGAEFLLFGRVPLRAGYRFDPLGAAGGIDSHAVSGGVGYTGEAFAFEASLRRTVAGPSSTTILAGLTYFLDTTGLE